MAMHLPCMCSLTRIGNDCKEMSTKFLGVNLDETLSWKLHISHITRKISRTLFAIKQTKRILPLDSLKTLYTALIHPHISYGILAWGNVNKNTLKPLEILQKRAIRTINRAHFNSHTEPLFKSSAVLKVSDQYIFQVTMFMYDYTHGNLPNSFNRTYLYNHEIHRHLQTRQSNMLYIPPCYSHYCGRMPLYHFPRIWNNYSALYYPYRSQFKQSVKISLIESYSSHIKCNNTHCRDCTS